MTHIKTRGDVSGAWSSANPVLLADEVGIETDTHRTKQGDGTTAWNSLTYASAPFNNAALTGTPTAPTAAGGTNTTQIATTQFVQATLAPKANTASPAFTGNPTAPTPTAGDNDTSLATTAFVQAALSAALSTAVAAAILASHPVGSIFMSVSPTNPGGVLGGTWVAWGTGQVPVGVDTGQTEFATVEETGGAKTVDISHVHAMAHTHPLSVSNNDNITGGASRVNAANTGASSAANTSVAGSTTLNNLPPYITCWMFKRTA